MEGFLLTTDNYGEALSFIKTTFYQFSTNN